MIKKLIHNSDGTLVEDTPFFLREGTEVRITSGKYKGYICYITDKSIKSTLDLRTRHYKKNVYVAAVNGLLFTHLPEDMLEEIK